jgi:hypothetical protein
MYNFKKYFLFLVLIVKLTIYCFHSISCFTKFKKKAVKTKIIVFIIYCVNDYVFLIKSVVFEMKKQSKYVPFSNQTCLVCQDNSHV